MKRSSSAVIAGVIAFCLPIAVQAQDPAGPKSAPAPKDAVAAELEGLKGGLYARIETDLGVMVMRLHYQQTPLTVANFVGLAEGKIGWKDPKTKRKMEKQPFYNDRIFHRVIKGFMIQGGCPAGNGSGNPGYRFSDEIVPALKHDGFGVLAMANSGVGTNGCQFYITLGAAERLDGRYTIFGKLVRGKETLEKLGGVPTDGFDAPKTPVKMKTITIHRIGESAKAWNLFNAGRKALTAKLPEGAPGPADPAKVPDPKAAARTGLGVEILVVSWRGAKDTLDLIPYGRQDARGIAKRIVGFAREKDRDFSELVKLCPNFRSGSAAFDSLMSRRIPPYLKDQFHLREGQVSDPIETPGGWMILRGVETLSFRVLGTREAEGSDPKGTKAINKVRAETRARAEVLRAALEKGEKWSSVFKRSQVRISKDGYIGTYLRKALPKTLGRRLGKAFSEACSKLEPGQISPVIETRAGHVVVQRQD